MLYYEHDPYLYLDLVAIVCDPPYDVEVRSMRCPLGGALICLTVIFLIGCGPAPTASQVAVQPTATLTPMATPTPTATPTATDTPAPTVNPTATSTPTLTSTPTATPTASPTVTSPSTATATSTDTPEPTATHIPTPTPFSAADFSVQVVGYGVHGAMIELLYSGDPSNLEGLVIRMRIGQDGHTKEIQTVKVLNGRYLTEMTDANYKLGMIDVEISLDPASSAGSVTSIKTGAAFEHLLPWMRYYYGESCLASRLSYPWDPDHLEAWDLQPLSGNFPDGLGAI